MRKEQPRRKSPKKERFTELIEAAEDTPGEWFAEDFEGAAGGISGTIYSHFGRKLVEVRTYDGTLYVRVK